MRRRYQRIRLDAFALRLTVIVTLIVMTMVFIVIRLFVRSVVAHEATLSQAQKQYLVQKQIDPHRGQIYVQDSPDESDSLTVPLTTNRRTYALSVIPKDLKNPKRAAEILAEWTQMSVDELYQKINNNKPYLPPLRHGLNEEQKNQLAELNLTGLVLIEEEERYYPEGSLAAQTLGFVNADKVGNYGIEQKYQAELAGSGGQILAERDARGQILVSWDQLPVRDGSELVLTIDRNVQKFVEQTLRDALKEFEAVSGTIVVMDVETGGIIALANEPTFDPNEFRKVPTEEMNRFSNPAIGAVWEPGSIFKTLVMATALDQGVVEPETEGVFSNSVTIGGYEIHTAEDKAFGRETMTQVLENSDNVAMVWLAEQLGNERMYSTLKKFGFGGATGLDLPGEVAGRMPALKDWREINRSTIAFGQGISVTPVQLVTALSAMANGGDLMQPHLVKEIIGPDGTVQEIPLKIKTEGVISQETATQISAMMVSVVERGHGKRAKVPGYQIAGKTGTAQVPRPSEEGGGYYEDRHIGGFGGFFPANQPRFAMVVKLDQPKTVRFAESSAAPTFGKIAQFMLNYYRIPPTEPLD